MTITNIGNLRKYTALAVVIFTLFAGSAQAQKVWSLQECIDVAIKNNIAVKQRELNQEAARADYKQSRLGLLPNVNGQLTHNYNTGFAINPATNTAEQDVTFRNNSMGISANMNLFNGFQQTNNMRLQQSNVKAVDQDVEATRNNLRLTLANAYLQVLMNMELNERNRMQVEFTNQQVTRQEKLVELGAANRVKLLQLKAQKANEELAIIAGQNQLDQAYLTLWQLMNVEPDTSNKIVRPQLDITGIAQETQSAQDIYRGYLDRSPDVLAARQRARSAEISRYISLGGRSPRISVNATISSFYSTQTQQPTGTLTLVPRQIGTDINGNPVTTPYPSYTGAYQTTPFSDQFDRNLGKTLGFTLSVPIFNGWQVNTGVQKSRINEFSAHLTEKQAQNDLYKNITQAHQDLSAAQKKYEANQNSFEANKESHAVAESQFSLGAISTTEYLNIKNEFLKAQASYTQSKYELVFRRKVLDFYLGKPL